MKTKFNYEQFDIGDWVKVTKILYIISSEHERKKIDIPGKIKPRLGRITGVKYLREGKIELPFDADAYFIHKNTIICWEIRTGLTNKPFYALPEDIELCALSDIENLEFPILKGEFDQWKGHQAEQLKRDLSEDSKLWPRDEKGRWIKQNLSIKPT